MSTDYLYQVIHGKTIFVIHEYLYGVRSNNSSYQDLSELSMALKLLPPNSHSLMPMYGSDKFVRDNSDI